jgi:hypothetical protein
MPSAATVNKFRPYTAEELDAIAEQLTAKYATAQADLLKILSRGDISSWKRAFTVQQLAQIEAITGELTQTAAFWTQTYVPTLYKHGMWTADGYLQPGGLSKFAHPGEWTPMDLGMAQMHDVAIKELAENAALKLGNANSYCAQRIESMMARTQALGQVVSTRDAQFAISNMQWGIRDASLDAMGQAFAQGETMREAEKRFLAELNKRGITSFVDAAGREWDMQRYAQMVARTVSQEAQTHGQLNRLMEDGHDLVEVIGHSIDGKADVCDQYEGKVLSIAGKTPGMTTVDEARAAGLLHPGCVHTLVPKADEAA